MPMAGQGAACGVAIMPPGAGMAAPPQPMYPTPFCCTMGDVPARAKPLGEPANMEPPPPMPLIPSSPPKTPPVGATASKGFGVAKAEGAAVVACAGAMFHTGVAAANGLEGVAAAAP